MQLVAQCFIRCYRNYFFIYISKKSRFNFIYLLNLFIFKYINIYINIWKIYYPDFIIDGKLYEIKGYENNKAKAKHEQHPEVIYLDKYKMKKYLDYVISKYGKDYIKLYDRLDKQVE